VTLALGNVYLPWNLIEAGSKLSLTRGICGLSFGFNYVVTIMLFSLSLVLQEGSADETQFKLV